jgi:hypothetical protein
MPTMRAVVRKPRILVFAAMGCWLMLPAAAIEIPEGAHLLLRMVNTVSTKTAQPGDYVYMRTASPISVDGRTVVPVNSYVQGVVTHTKRSGKVSGRAQLGIRLETLTLRRGKVLKISPLLSSVDSNQSRQRVDREENLVRQGPDHGRDAARIVILAGSGASIGGIVDRGWKGAGVGAGIGGAVGLATVMLSRGREVQLRQGTAIDVVFERAVTLE